MQIELTHKKLVESFLLFFGLDFSSRALKPLMEEVEAFIA